jgi:hypothetical protein
MSKPDEYRRFAEKALTLAEHQNDRLGKTHLLLMAEAWLKLAERAGQRLQQRVERVGDHPLVAIVLGTEQIET